MTVGPFGQATGLTEFSFHLQDTWPDTVLRNRSVGYHGLYNPPPDDQMSQTLRACSNPEWFRCHGGDFPDSPQNGGVVFSGTTRQAMQTPARRADGEWEVTLSASNGTTEDVPLFLRWFARPSGAGYAVRIEGGGGGAADLSLVRFGADDQSDLLESVPGAIPDLTTESTIHISRTITGVQTLSVDGGEVASVRDTEFSDPMRFEFDYRPGGSDERSYQITSMEIR